MYNHHHLAAFGENHCLIHSKAEPYKFDAGFESVCFSDDFFVSFLRTSQTQSNASYRPSPVQADVPKISVNENNYTEYKTDWATYIF